jgi:copper(I)-binding protein
VNVSRVSTVTLAAALVVGSLAGCTGGSTPAARHTSAPASPGGPAVSVTGAQVRVPTVPDVTAAYLRIKNTGTADTLTGVSTPAAARVEMHRLVVKGGTMTMEPVKSVPVPANGTVEFTKGGMHLMLMKPKALAIGRQVRLTLHFTKAGDVTVPAEVVPVTGSSPTTH